VGQKGHSPSKKKTLTQTKFKNLKKNLKSLTFTNNKRRNANKDFKRLTIKENVIKKQVKKQKFKWKETRKDHRAVKA
jgi:hypothetical protein